MSLRTLTGKLLSFHCRRKTARKESSQREMRHFNLFPSRPTLIRLIFINKPWLSSFVLPFSEKDSESRFLFTLSFRWNNSAGAQYEKGALWFIIARGEVTWCDNQHVSPIATLTSQVELKFIRESTGIDVELKWEMNVKHYRFFFR